MVPTGVFGWRGLILQRWEHLLAGMSAHPARVEASPARSSGCYAAWMGLPLPGGLCALSCPGGGVRGKGPLRAEKGVPSCPALLLSSFGMQRADQLLGVASSLKGCCWGDPSRLRHGDAPDPGCYGKGRFQRWGGSGAHPAGEDAGDGRLGRDPVVGGHILAWGTPWLRV